MPMILKKVCNILSWIIIVAVVLLAALLVGVRVIGLTPFAIISPSMSPKYPVGSLVYVKSVPQEDLAVGDTITFLVSDDTVCTHRIYSVNDDGTFITKGDANDDVDSGYVIYQNVIGKVVFSLPVLGNVSKLASDTTGRLILVAVVAFGFLLMIIPELFKKEEKEE